MVSSWGASASIWEHYVWCQTGSPRALASGLWPMHLFWEWWPGCPSLSRLLPSVKLRFKEDFATSQCLFHMIWNIRG